MLAAHLLHLQSYSVASMPQRMRATDAIKGATGWWQVRCLLACQAGHINTSTVCESIRVQLLVQAHIRFVGHGGSHFTLVAQILTPCCAGDLQNALEMHDVGDTVSLSVLRSGGDSVRAPV